MSVIETISIVFFLGVLRFHSKKLDSTESAIEVMQDDNTKKEDRSKMVVLRDI